MAPWTLAHQAPLSIEFSRLEYWSGLPFPTPQHLPDPGIEPVSLCTSCDGRQFCYHCATWEDATDVDSWTIKSTTELMLSNCGAGEDSREPLKKQGNQTSQSSRKSILNIHWKHLCWSWSSNILPDVKSQFIGKDPDAGKDWRQEKGVTEDEMVGWHNWLNGHEFEQTLRADGQGGLEYCSPWCHRVRQDWATDHHQQQLSCGSTMLWTWRDYLIWLNSRFLWTCSFICKGKIPTIPIIIFMKTPPSLG